MFMGPKEGLVEGKRKEIKAWSTTFLCSRSSWRRNYLERIKIVMDQAPLDLGLVHIEVFYFQSDQKKLNLMLIF
ncbi:unnamed protein product [Spirodela intermedia]|uniref:Uncharacterized protein n=1 Tax=Spirodela intermedia TaxID=51605 RepID=A0A7I8K3R5_SPIIN|nr:unnamed protein product [Spirodela intermedia]